MNPIIENRLDTDYYLFTMGQAIERHYPDIEVEYALMNRSDIPLGTLLDLGELQEQVDHLRSLSFTSEEFAYLRRFFSERYIASLMDHKLPEIEIARDGDQLRVWTRGPWKDGIFWETPLMAIITEMYGRKMVPAGTSMADIFDQGDHRSRVKQSELGVYPVSIMEFGTRRRFSREWQQHVIEPWRNSRKLVGTSNVHLARTMEMQPMGTMAHQLFMVLAAISNAENPLITSTFEALDTWESMYEGSSLIALTDTFGTKFFLRHFDGDRAEKWAGFRQDSGDPVKVAEEYLDYFRYEGVNPYSKTIVFSDGLKAETIRRLHNRFNGEFRMAFGWGTNLTNDVGIAPLPIVFKPVNATYDGRTGTCVKLSDNIRKATGQDIERVRKLAGDIDEFDVGIEY